MKLLKYKAEQFNTDNAHQVCLDLETQLGVNLMNHDKNNPNEVHGFMNTLSDGTIEVYLYEQEDIDVINSLPDTNIEEIEIEKNGKKVKEQRTYKIKENVLRKKCHLTDQELITKCETYFVVRGFQKV